LTSAFHEQQQPQRWCDTQSSELPQCKKEGEDLNAIKNATKIGTAPKRQKMSRSVSALAGQFKEKLDIAGVREY
jgi:hypothetical protein